MRACFFVVLAALAAAPWLATAGSFNLFRDAQVMWSYEDQARRTVLEFLELPLWNPEYCGGLPALGTPQARFASPTFLVTLLFGTTRAEPILIFGMVLLALFGAYRLAREWGATPAGATLGAPTFGLIGLFACAPFLGWFSFLGFAALPWILVGLREAAKGHARGIALVGLATAFVIGFGGTYVAPISLVASVLEVLLLVAQRRRIDWSALALAGLLTIGLSAFRLWPVWEELQRGPRVISGASNVGLSVLGGFLFGTNEPLNVETWYLVTAPAAILSAIALLRRRGRWLAACLLLWFWLALGHAATPSLYEALRSLPVFSLLRNSERFLTCVGLVFSIGLSCGISDTLARVRRASHWQTRPRRLALASLVLTLVGLSISIPWQLWNFRTAASKRTLTAPPRERLQPFHQARGNRWAVAGFGPMSRGSLACWEAYAVPQSTKLRGDRTEEAWLADGGAGTLRETHWSPNRLGFTATLERATRVLINQNYHRGWKTSLGTVVNDEGLLAVELPAGTSTLELRFLPRSAVGGLITSSFALLALFFVVRAQRRSLVHFAAALAPLGLAAALALTNPEPLLPSTEPRGPEGEPLLVDALPEGVTRATAQFEGGYSIEGVSAVYRPEDDRVRLEIDWSRTTSANQRLGIFLHIEPGTLKRITADHLQLSDVYFLEQIPPGRTARDILLIDVPTAKRGPPWNLWLGLWEMRGDGQRMKVLQVNGLTTAEDRVLVGTVQIPQRP